MNKFEQVSSDDHQMPLARGPRSDVQGGTGAPRSDVRCVGWGIGQGAVQLGPMHHG